jgi:hypothetical protein
LYPQIKGLGTIKLKTSRRNNSAPSTKMILERKKGKKGNSKNLRLGSKDSPTHPFFNKATTT